MPLLPAASESVPTLSKNNKQTKIKMTTLPSLYENEKQTKERSSFLTRRQTLMWFYYMIFMHFLMHLPPYSLQQLLAHFNQDSQTRLSFKHSKICNIPAQLMQPSRHSLLQPLPMDTQTLGGYTTSQALPKPLPQILELRAGFGLHLGRDA